MFLNKLIAARQPSAPGLVCICADCHKIRDDQGRWSSYDGDPGSGDIELTHGFCPVCLTKRKIEVEEFILNQRE